MTRQVWTSVGTVLYYYYSCFSIRINPGNARWTPHAIKYLTREKKNIDTNIGSIIYCDRKKLRRK